MLPENLVDIWTHPNVFQLIARFMNIYSERILGKPLKYTLIHTRVFNICEIRILNVAYIFLSYMV